MRPGISLLSQLLDKYHETISRGDRMTCACIVVYNILECLSLPVKIRYVIRHQNKAVPKDTFS